MASSDLTAISGSGTQSATQSPQTASSSQFGGTPSGNVQPDSTVNLFSNQSGVSLNATPLTTLNLNSTSSSTATVTALPPKHHTNTLLLGLTGVLIIAAIIMIWQFSKSAKNTTYQA